MEEKRPTLAEQQIYLVDECVFMQKSLPPQVESTPPDSQHQTPAESNNIPKENSSSKKYELCRNKKHVTASIISLMALVAVIVVLVVLLAHDGLSSKSESSLASTLLKLMTNNEEITTELGREYCGNVGADNEECLTNNNNNDDGGMWISINHQSNEWKEISSALHNSSSSLSISPPYIIPQQTCSISINSQNNSNQIQLIAAVSMNTSQTLQLPNITSQLYQTKDIINSTERIRFIIRQSSQPILLTFHGCINHIPVDKYQTETSIRLVHHHQHDRCSFEFYESGKVDCDWWTISSPDPTIGEFERAESANSELCLQHGLESNPVSNKYFIKFSSVDNTPAYLVSPLFSTDESRELIYSFHDQLICDGSELRAYIVPRNFHLFAAVSETSPFLRIDDVMLNWDFQINSTIIPEHLSEFHVLLEAVVSMNNGSCGQSDFCELPPTIAIDEILLEMNSHKCSPTSDNASIPIDITFEDDVIHGWTINNQICGISEEETSGLVCTVYNTEAEFMLRSSLLRANSNCSCVIHFRYQIDTPYMFPIFLTQKFGNDTTKHDEKQKILWSEKLSNVWQEASVNLKLVENGQVFLLEFNEIGTDGLQHHFKLNNLTFENCDFSVVDSGNNS